MDPSVGPRPLEGARIAAPAAMPPPTEAREGAEGYSGLVGDACARQLDVPSTVTQCLSSALTPSMLLGPH